MESVSVIISTYTIERVSCVLDCINSLRKQTLPPKEIILVLDPDEKLVEFYKTCAPDDVKIIVSKGRGLSYARNAGVKRAEGEIVAFIDDDAVADERWLENLIKNYGDPHVIGVGGLIEPLWESSRPIWLPEELDWIIGCSYKGLPEYRAVIRNPIGCNMSFRREVFEKVGFFRSDVGRFGKRSLSGEEPDFSIRVLKNLPEAKILYDPSAIVYHKVIRSRLSLKYLFMRSLNEGVSKAMISNSAGSLAFLSTERNYLRYLFRVAIPSRLRHLYNLNSLLQLASLFLSLTGFSLGYIFYKILR
ncbi:glycosyltransferase family 2 protein [Candidatus Bathyarchaeota archaeon]|nr:glycosyltransferase family 2 protein [Candidatus Bathyarchaeota archaeon]